MIAAVLAVGGGATALWTRARRLRRVREASPGDPTALAIDELHRALRRSGRRVGPDTTLHGLATRFAGTGRGGLPAPARHDALRRDAARADRSARAGLRRALAVGAGPLGRIRSLWALPPSPPSLRRFADDAATVPESAGDRRNRAYHGCGMDNVYDLFQAGTKLLEERRLPRRRRAPEAGRGPRSRQDLDPRGARPRALPRAAYEAAAAEFEAIVEHAPTNDYALFCLGRSLQQLGRHREARHPLALACSPAARARGLPASTATARAARAA